MEITPGCDHESNTETNRVQADSKTQFVEVPVVMDAAIGFFSILTQGVGVHLRPTIVPRLKGLLNADLMLVLKKENGLYLRYWQQSIHV